MDTPIYDFLRKYSGTDTLRCHMPGHKGRGVTKDMQRLCELDITEIAGADSLFEADGIIRKSEKNMARLYGTAGTFYSAGGSTLCIQAMLAAMKSEGRTVVAVRNVHRAFLNAAALLDLDIEWVMPHYTDGILSGTVDISEAEEKLRSVKKPCLYITSPDYTGRMADIQGLAEMCRKHRAPLLVDNAHGAHLHFMPVSHHPIALGATMCCDSAHKMLPALTGAAMLHTSSRRYAKMLRQCMSLFASTSPSYLIMASLDLCNRYISEDIRNDTVRALQYIKELRESFSGRLIFADGDPFHITVKAAESGYDGNSFADVLRKNKVECEYSDSSLVILLMSPFNMAEDYLRLCIALEDAVASAEKCEKVHESFYLPLPEKVMSVRQAVFSLSETIPVDEAEGCICASVKVPCPPAVPIAVSGEVISRECIDIFKRYGISEVIVVRKW